MTPVPADDATGWLDDLLARGATPAPADNGFSDKVMHRIDALAKAAEPAESAACVPSAVALVQLPAVQERERRRQSWIAAGVLAAAGIGILCALAQPHPANSAALVLTSFGLLWLLMRDPQF